MAAKQILVLGGGFAGLWSAVGAARKLNELSIGPDAVEVTLVNRDAYHGIRVRNYEGDLSEARVLLDDVLAPIGVRRVEADVIGIDAAARTVALKTADRETTVPYDRLVFALGSQLVWPPVPGLAEYGFDVDTYANAARLNAHIESLPARPDEPGVLTVVVVGAGLTGIEVATAMPGTLTSALARARCTRPFRVLIIDHHPHAGADLGPAARPVIDRAISALGIETRLGVGVTSVTETGVTLASGESVATQTLVWCAGMRANPLTHDFAVNRDALGRMPVDPYLRVVGVPAVFAAGDGAAASMDGTHASVMSCQHARPMGRFAGHNVVCDLLGLPMLPLRVDWYVTVVDLGPQAALYTEGWDRKIVATGEVAKETKQTINCRRIYPPLTRNPAEILAAAAPVADRPPRYEQSS